MKTTLTTLLIAAASLLWAQDLHIYYDIQTDSIYYRMDGKPVKAPQLRKGQKAVLHAINYNDYLYDLELVTEEENYRVPSSGSVSPFSAAGGGLLGRLQGLTGGMNGTGFDLQGTNIGNEVDGFVESSQLSSQAKAVVQRYTLALDQMKDHEEEIQGLAELLEKDISAQRLSNMAYSEVQRLKQNPELPPDKIRKLSMEYMEPVLRPGRDGSLEVRQLIDRSDANAQFQATLMKYKGEIGGLESEMAQLSALHELLATMESISPEDKLALDASHQAAQRRVNDYQATAEAMQEQLAGVEQLDLVKLTELAYLYEEMKDHRFERQFLIKPETDITNLKLKLIPTDSARLKGARERSLKPIDLNTYGGLKVNASVGISFTSFFDRPQAYSVRDSLIVGDDEDAFLPVISSFVHFYPQSRRQVSVGGTFGIGLGVGGDDAGLQNFFFGPSLILGKGQRVVFSTGLMGGRVERLAQGYEVGDLYELGQTLPTKEIYELGYFLGISFNLLGE